MANINDTYASVLSGYSGSVNDRRSELLTSILGYTKPLSLNDMEAAALASLGYTGALNDAWDKYIKALGGFGISAKADYLSSTFYGNPVPFLFASSQTGVWYDPSDLTTMFQDDLGSTPVTTAGQTVGLILDKSQGVVVGNELVANGNFATASNWTTGTGWSISGGTANFVISAGGNLTQSIGISGGKYYKVNFTISGTTSVSFFGVRLGGTSNLASYTGVSDGTKSIILLAQSSDTVLKFAAGTSGPITIDNVSVKLISGNHATQVTSTQRPTYQIDSTGRPYLLFDGVDDGMVTGTITPGTDKVQVFAGVRKLSDALKTVIVEMSATIAGNAGVFNLTTSNSSTTNYGFSSKGTVQTDNIVAPYTAPITNVVSALGDIAGSSNLVRVNGTQAGSVLTNQGTGNFLAYPLYIGRRGGSSLPFNGRLYSMIVRFGANLTTGQITSTETYVNGKTGAY